MKKITFLVAAYLLGLSVTAQQSNNCKVYRPCTLSASQQILLLDSMLCYNEDEVVTQKQYYEYDNQKRVTSNKTLIFFQKWQNQDKTDYTYNEAGQKESKSLFTADFNNTDPVTGGWIPSEKEVYTYNERKDLIRNERWNGDFMTHEWLLSGKDSTIYAYDEEDRIIGIKRIQTDQFSPEWRFYNSDTITYNSMGLPMLVERYIEDWQTGEPTKQEQDEYTYDEDGNLISEIKSMPSMESTKFNPISKIFYTYGEESEMLSKEYYNVNGDKDVPSKRIAFAYNDQGYLETETFYENNNMLPDFPKEYTSYNKYFYTKPVGITDQHSETLYATTESNMVTLYGLQPGSLINIYSLTGQTVYSHISSNDQESILLPEGYYMIRIADQTLKVVIRK